MDDLGAGGERDRRVEQLERRVDSLEQRTSMMDRSRTAMGVIVPQETRQHLRAAGREQLLAVRSLLDYWIGRLRDDGEQPTGTSSREEIRVD
jgi:hypothetical protein